MLMTMTRQSIQAYLNDRSGDAPLQQAKRRWSTSKQSAGEQTLCHQPGLVRNPPRHKTMRWVHPRVDQRVQYNPSAQIWTVQDEILVLEANDMERNARCSGQTSVSSSATPHLEAEDSGIQPYDVIHTDRWSQSMLQICRQFRITGHASPDCNMM